MANGIFTQNESVSGEKNSMVEIFVNFLSFLLLGVIATAVGILYFQIINRYFPDILSGTYESYQFSGFDASLIHYSIASIIVGFPIYLWAIWFWFKSFYNLPQKTESKLSKWLTYVILLIAGGAIIGDLITVLYNFLQGEFGARFLLKALVILIIACFVFIFYFLERKKIQYKKEVSPAFFGILAVLAFASIILALIFGFIAGGTPFEARIKKFDLQRTQDLQQLSSCVSGFSYDSKRLPKNLDELKNNARYNYCASRITDPENNKSYEYNIISENEFELCAEFNLPYSNDSRDLGYYGIFAKHGQGRVCEKQTVTFGNLPVPLERSFK